MSTKWFDPRAELALIGAAIPAQVAIAASYQAFPSPAALRSPAIDTWPASGAIAGNRIRCDRPNSCDATEIAAIATFAGGAVAPMRSQPPNVGHSPTRQQIHAVLETFGPSATGALQRLIVGTRAFVDSGHFERALALEWSMLDMFGISPIAPLVRIAEQGLVTFGALSTNPVGVIQEIETTYAVITFPSGARQRYCCGMPAIRSAVLWWDWANAALTDPCGSPLHERAH